MATIQELLEALNTKPAPVASSELARELGATTETTLTQLKREKEKGNVDGNSKEGWLITDQGREALEKGVHPSMIDEGVTPRQRFEAIGQRIGINKDRIVLAADIVWSGDFNDIKWVWDALGQADIANDLRSVWVNAWRAKLHKAIPPDLEIELTGAAASKAAESVAAEIRAKVPARDYIIVDDEPVRVGTGLGDYALQDAKDILAIRALKSRFAGTGQAGVGQSGAMEKVSELLTALEPYINKGSDLDSLKEILSDKLALQRQEILSHIPQPGQAAAPKTFIEQLTDFAGAMGQLKNAGPMIRSVLGVPESSSNPLSGIPVQLTDKEGKPIVFDISTFFALEDHKDKRRREEESHETKMDIAKAFKEMLNKATTALTHTAEGEGE